MMPSAWVKGRKSLSGASTYYCTKCYTEFLTTSRGHAELRRLSCPHLWLYWVGSLFYAPPRPMEATRAFMAEKARKAVRVVKIGDGTAYFLRRRRNERRGS